MIFGLVYKFIVGCVFVFLGCLSEAGFCATPKNLAKNQRYRQDYDIDPKTTIILSFVPDCVFPLSFNGK